VRNKAADKINRASPHQQQHSGEDMNRTTPQPQQNLAGGDNLQHQNIISVSQLPGHQYTIGTVCDAPLLINFINSYEILLINYLLLIKATKFLYGILFYFIIPVIL